MSKQDKLISLLIDGEYHTVEEMSDTGLKKTSIRNYLKYYFNKIGYDVLVGDKLGILAYKIEKI